MGPKASHVPLGVPVQIPNSTWIPSPTWQKSKVRSTSSRWGVQNHGSSWGARYRPGYAKGWRLQGERITVRNHSSHGVGNVKIIPLKLRHVEFIKNWYTLMFSVFLCCICPSSMPTTTSPQYILHRRYLGCVSHFFSSHTISFDHISLTIPKSKTTKHWGVLFYSVVLRQSRPFSQRRWVKSHTVWWKSNPYPKYVFRS